MEITVRLFAILRERAGRDTLSLELPAGARVADVLAAAGHEPGLDQILPRMPVRAALNREYVADDTVVHPGDELALIPPVSGGEAGTIHAAVSEAPLSVEALAAAVSRPGAGATIVFCGTTRDVDSLVYEAYAEMASERIEAILAECLGRHGLEAVAAEHRIGRVPLGEPSVIVAVSAAHRGEAFAGAREAIDRIKGEAPIWKQEVEGEQAQWVEGTEPPLAAPATTLTHLDRSGTARMVDVGDKPVSERLARAEARVRMSPATAALVASGDAPKGDVFATARIAGIGAAKRTWELIPLCHLLALDSIDVEGSVDEASGLVTLAATASTTAKTGVEMEAMTAVTVAALTVYDMVKGVERGVAIEAVELVHKSGGRSGTWNRNDAESR